jgi:hypothetical protein
MKASNTKPIALRPSFIFLKPSTKSGMSGFCISYDNHCPSITSSSNPFCKIGFSSLKLPLPNVPYPQFMPGFSKAVFSDRYYIIYTADLTTSPTATIASFADDTAVLYRLPATTNPPRRSPILAPKVVHAGQHTQIASRNVHQTYWKMPSCLHEQCIASLRGPCQIPRTISG